MIVNRLKKNQSTLCTFTKSGRQIREGHILGYGDNYPCIVIYDKFEAQFRLLEFGYMDDGYPYRHHEILCSTVPFKILGHIDNPKDWRKYISKLKVPRNFDYTKENQEYYDHQ